MKKSEILKILFDEVDKLIKELAENPREDKEIDFKPMDDYDAIEIHEYIKAHWPYKYDFYFRISRDARQMA